MSAPPQRASDATRLAPHVIDLYSRPMPSTRGGALYNAHSYVTKINAASIVPFILAHTEPGDTVYDGFAGTGATGLAAALCSRPDEVDKSVMPEALRGEVKWGARRSVLYDVGRLAAFISNTLLHPPDSAAFDEAAGKLLTDLERDYGWMYEVEDPDGETGVLRHIVHTEHVLCPQCGAEHTYRDLVLDLEEVSMDDATQCDQCGAKFSAAEATRVTERTHDDVLDRMVEHRKRTPALVYGRTGKTYWRRDATPADFDKIHEIAGTPIPEAVPVVRMMKRDADKWGHMHRAGYHQGISHLHHFYTRRNLIAVGAAWEATAKWDEPLCQALRFWISSYNASHATLMARVVCKKSAGDLVVTSMQPGALYVSSLPVEKNVFKGLSRKQSAMKRAFHKASKLERRAEVRCASSLDVDLPDHSVDYIFTDPPFGENIQYAEVNFINEAWLGNVTDTTEEVIVSSYQEKSLADYQELLRRGFQENHRILKPGGLMTVNFNSASRDVWKAVRQAWQQAGFRLERVSLLDKKQSSFKQVTTDGAVKGDALLLLRRADEALLTSSIGITRLEVIDDVWEAVDRRLAELASADNTDATARTHHRLYSWLLSFCLRRGQAPPINAKEFFIELEQRYTIDDNGRYFRSPQVT